MHKNLKIFTFLFTVLYFFSSTALPALAAVTYTYDQNGNMSSDGTECFEYNDANQLKKVKSCSANQTIAEYVYNHNGNRVIKKVFSNGVLQKTVYSPSDDFETVKLASNSATQNTSYYLVNNQLVAKKNPDGTKQYYHNDHLGSTSVLTNQAGALVEETQYDPWGEVKTGGTKSKFQYTGQEKDDETGLNYYNFRYYDSHIRRFTQPDDIIQDPYNPQDLNRYSYVRNNPLRYTDPSGHGVWIPAAIVVGGGLVGGYEAYSEFVYTNPKATWQQKAQVTAGGVAAGSAGAAAALYLGAGGVVARFVAVPVAAGTFNTEQILHANMLSNQNPFKGAINSFTTGAILSELPLTKLSKNSQGRPAEVFLDRSIKTVLKPNSVSVIKKHTVANFIESNIKLAVTTVLSLFNPPKAQSKNDDKSHENIKRLYKAAPFPGSYFHSRWFSLCNFYSKFKLCRSLVNKLSAQQAGRRSPRLFMGKPMVAWWIRYVSFY
jgi:RHS repeat-associated protein